MKKLIALLLTFAMVFMLAACGTPDNEPPEPCTEHVDTDNNYKCDKCDTDMTPAGLTLANALFSQFNDVKSLKLDLELKTTLEESAWGYVSNGDGNDSLTPDERTLYEDSATNIYIVTSINKNGGLDAKVDVSTKHRDDKTAEYEVENLGTVVYIINGVTYSYNEEVGAYIIEDSENAAEVTEILTALLDGVEFSKPTNEELTKLGDLIITTFNIKEYKGSVSIDAKPIADDFLAYVKALDMEKDTVRGVLDDALALIDKELTTAKLLTELERVAGLTVNAAIAELDAKLTEKYNTTLQGIYDSLIKDENVLTIVENYLELMYTEGEGGELSDEAKTAIEETLNEIKAFKIADAISEAEIGEIKLYDLILTYIIGISPADSMTATQLFDYAEQLADMTLAEFEEESGTVIFTTLKQVASSITVNELNAKLDINFKGIFEIDTIEGAINLDMTNTTESAVEGKNNVSRADLSMTFKLYDLSKDAITIALPEDKPAIKDIFGYYNSDNPEYYMNFYIHTDKDGISIQFTAYDEDYNSAYVTARNITLEQLISGKLEIDASNIQIVYRSVIEELAEGEKLTITIDTENFMFSVEKYPAFADETIPALPLPNEETEG